MTTRPDTDDRLARLQRGLLAQVRGCGADGGADGGAERGIDGLLAHGRMPAALGLGIYSHAYGARLREALEHDHAVLGIYLGDALWERMCEGYIATHPSRVRSLRDFASDLPGFLASAEPFAAHPQLADLARFERCLLDGFDAADGERLAWDDLLALPEAAWPFLQPTLHPSFRLYQAGFNSVEIWQAIKAGQTPPAAATTHACWGLWRDEERVSRFRSLDSRERIAISHLLHGGGFAGLCEALATDLSLDDVPAAAIGYLQSWCAEGWLSRLC
ncbi:DNA-binding domain-containing protein [Lysobacter sp. S4-A87]|uniref:HvfC/BufC N-terminal domain-containing protein n=1 Tax=Lysobacter sp. S4-A87 TaxID=2925843 RepID=UPI001F53D1E7|nr:DNA-binding domain-containing protein [Lysobacter sp. S4-A87]UNK48213.1 DNA-binding domain-containing protein [Lysobacter sp. S4-A87]